MTRPDSGPRGVARLGRPYDPAEGAARTAWLLPTELPRDRLALLGLPYDPARAGERVRAELLVDAQGEVLAVRVLD
ncbi:hypothetical protein ABXN37_16300 [Piscinibacter sakaiensis]|uniref:hypothetical protein n=1 Tax=Piscinibacter sakaiensis TaxID=1547922 RepID=UPI00372628A1